MLYSLTIFACAIGAEMNNGNCFAAVPPYWFDTEQECITFLIEEAIPLTNAGGAEVHDFDCNQWTLERSS